jgi:aspartyl-tRNA(Asn)/glutamyl-tRNA(Gln) amidotransferase subunit A
VSSLPQTSQYFSAFDNYFLQAQRIRRLVRDDFDRVFHAPNVLSSHPSTLSSSHPFSQSSNPNIDVLLHPSAIRTAPLLPPSSSPSSTLSSSAGLDAYVQDVLTVPASLAGLPALSVPACSGADGWPVGVSIVGQWGCDELVLRVGEIVEEL